MMKLITLLTVSLWSLVSQHSAAAVDTDAATVTVIALGYETSNDVSEMLELGTDLETMDAAFPDLAAAQDIYENGSSGNATSNTFQGLSFSSSPLEKFMQYYGSSDYANEYILAGFSNNATSFTHGNSDFSTFGPIGQREIVKKGAQYLTAFMNVIERLGDAVALCESKVTEESILAWDKAVALFYGREGNMVYDMGEKRCENFGTCNSADDDGTTSQVNMAIFAQFIEGQEALGKKKCEDVAESVETIVEHMYIPLVQGVIRAAYKLSSEGDGGEKQRAFGAVFSAAVLPFVHACTAEDATLIHTQMAPDDAAPSTVDFAAVKAAFENNYACLDIDCAMVGGLVDKDGVTYLVGAEPCGIAVMGGGPGSAGDDDDDDDDDDDNSWP
mmetsp:Transcript_27187/g.30544  ORF Transcript_27187/g.30544 Transcript_27187/m.30544 type:complete len:387 (+) Transcript_27187:96-1256(+)